MTRFIVTVIISALSTLAASQALADTRVTVHDFYGPNAERVHDDVVNLLERQSGVTIVSKVQVESTAMRLGVDPYSRSGRATLGRELQLSAWMTGVVEKRAGMLKLTLVVFNGEQLIGRTRLLGRTPDRLSAAIKARLWRKSRPALMRAAASSYAGAEPAQTNAAISFSATSPGAVPSTDGRVDATDDVSQAGAGPNEAPSPAPTPDAAHTAGAASSLANSGELASAPRDSAVDADIGDVATTAKRGEAFRAFLGIGSPYRSLAFISPATGSLGDYRLSGAPMVDVNLAFHPTRLFTDNWTSWFGLDVRGQLAFGTPTVDRDNNQFESHYGAYHLGLRARVPIGRQYISAFSGYAMNRFSVSAKNKELGSPTPSVDYRMIRSGLGAELAFSDSFTFGTDVALLQFLGVGDIGRWFPRATASGLEVATSATYNLTRGIFARAVVAYQRTAFDFNAHPGDAYTAAGATDEYLAMSLGAGIQL